MRWLVLLQLTQLQNARINYRNTKQFFADLWLPGGCIWLYPGTIILYPGALGGVNLF